MEGAALSYEPAQAAAGAEEIAEVVSDSLLTTPS
jgi:hypothetical protein